MSRGLPRFSLQSQTWKDISALLGKLPARRKRLVGFVLLASIFQGLLDLLLIAFLARFVGLFSGAKLADRLPGVLVFGGGILDQTGWLLALLIGSFWLTSLVRFLVSLMQSLLSAEIWNDLVNQVYGNVLQQRYEFFIEKERLYRIPSNLILMKYEYQGDEEEYNPSWTQSS